MGEVREIGQQMVALLGGYEEFPGPGVTTREDVEAYVRRYVGTMYHPACTCRMGNDPAAVPETSCAHRSLSLAWMANFACAHSSSNRA